MPLSAERTAKEMQLPDGFRATVFAAEPDVVQPMSFAIDGRGRLWVVECLSYPDWLPADKPGKDRVLILEDTDGDGRHDKSTVFIDNQRNLSGIALGFGGVYLLSTPEFLFIPDADGDDKPDGPPKVLLDGWSLQCRHNVVNGLTWGPDGWLYGLNGIIDTSFVGKPGAAKEDRTPLNCSVWRYHPTRHEFEVVCHGTTNPWGLDYDQYGQFFITNCVIKHLFHVIPGAHYIRMYGEDLSANTYDLMPSCADYLHWGGGDWTSSRGGQGVHDQPGGGHAHAGCMVYLGDNWPREYRRRLFTCNVHGKRVNSDILNRRGSGYDSDRAPDFLKTNDPWFVGLEMKYGPDGGVYMTDWSDIGECHHRVNPQKGTGRIYKITHKASGESNPIERVKRFNNIKAMSPEQLIEVIATATNEYHIRLAQRTLHNQAAAGKVERSTRDSLIQHVQKADAVPRKLRWLWAAHCCGRLSDEEAISHLKTAKSPAVRGWLIQLALEDRKASAELLEKFAQLAEHDDSPVVRLALASALQRLPVQDRWSIATALVAHAEDAADPNLPLMYWYGIEPLVTADRDRALQLIVRAKVPLVREFLARRLAAVK